MRATVEAFLSHLAREQEASVHTVEAYRNDLRQWVDHLAANGVSSVRQVTPERVAGFLRWLQDRPYAASTVARKMAAIRSFLRFVLDLGALDEDPSASVISPRVKRRTPRSLSAEEVERLLEALRGGSTPKAMRDRALLEVLYATGMRVSEVVALSLDDLDLEGGAVRCSGSRVGERLLPLSRGAIEALRVYLERGRPHLTRGEDAAVLFVNHRGRPITRQGLWLIVKERAEAAGLAEVTPGVLRHSFAAHMLGEGAGLREVQRRLGHANLATTQIYARGSGSDRAETETGPEE